MLLVVTSVDGAVRSTDGVIEFKVGDETKMTLNDQGLGIGKVPTASFDVAGNVNVESNLILGGGLVYGSSVVSGNINSIDLNSTSLLLVDTSAGAANITLPYSGNVSGQVLKIKATSPSNSVSIRPSSGSIDGHPFYKMLTDNTGTLPYLELMAYGNSWHVLNSSGTSYAYPPDGLLLYCNFDEMSGATTMTSSDITKRVGVITNTTFSGNGGVLGGALGFDGTNDYVDFKDPGETLDPTSVTVAVWVKADSFAVGSYLVSKSRDVSDSTPDGYSLRFSSGKVRAEFWSASDNLLKGTTGATALPTGTWVHLAMTYDGLSLIVYVNGVQDASSSVTGTIASSARKLTFGTLAYNQPNHFRFDGLMDEVFIYNRALSLSEINVLYQRGL